MNMNTNQKKQQQLNRGIAIAVAVLLALTLIVTVVAFSVSKRSSGASASPTLKTPAQTSSSETAGSSQTPSDSADVSTSPTEDEPTSASAPEFVCPVSGYLIKGYSADVPVFSDTMEDYRVHCGIDIGADAGAAVMAAADGEISAVYFDPMMGQTVEITHRGGYTTVYKNLQTKLPQSAAVGSTVKAGDTIGYVGDTAIVEISDSPHLHFEMINGEGYADPLSHISVPENDPASDYED